MQEEEGALKKKQAAAKVKAQKAHKRRSKTKAAAEPPREASAHLDDQAMPTSANRTSSFEGTAAEAAVSGSLVADKVANSEVTAKGTQEPTVAPTKPNSILPHWMVCILTKVCTPEDTINSCSKAPLLAMKACSVYRCTS